MRGERQARRRRARPGRLRPHRRRSGLDRRRGKPGRRALARRRRQPGLQADGRDQDRRAQAARRNPPARRPGAHGLGGRQRQDRTQGQRGDDHQAARRGGQDRSADGAVRRSGAHVDQPRGSRGPERLRGGRRRRARKTRASLPAATPPCPRGRAAHDRPRATARVLRRAADELAESDARAAHRLCRVDHRRRAGEPGHGARDLGGLGLRQRDRQVGRATAVAGSQAGRRAIRRRSPSANSTTC